MDSLLTPEQIAEKLGVKLSTIYNWTHIGFIPHVKIRRFVRIRESEIMRWLEKQAVAGRTKRGPSVL